MGSDLKKLAWFSCERAVKVTCFEESRALRSRNGYNLWAITLAKATHAGSAVFSW